MPIRFGNHTLTGHQGLGLETLRAMVTTGSVDPVLRPRIGERGNLPSLSLRRQQAPSVNTTPQVAAQQPENRVRVFTKRKPADRFIVSMDDDDKVIRQGAALHALDHDVPPGNVFHHSLSRIDNCNGEAIQQQSLAALTLGQRLDLHSHGARGLVNDLTPRQMAEWLHGAGLRNVGVLKIQACMAGCGDYLDQLKDELTRLDISVGYLSGPKGEVADMRWLMSMCGKQFAFAPLKFATGGANKVVSRALIPEPLAIKVVKGNVNIAFPVTRYSFKQRPQPRSAPQHNRRVAAQMGTHCTHVNDSRRMVKKCLLRQHNSCRAMARRLGKPASILTSEVLRKAASLPPFRPVDLSRNNRRAGGHAVGVQQPLHRAGQARWTDAPGHHAGSRAPLEISLRIPAQDHDL